MSTAEITLTKGFVAIVDEEDLRFLSQWKWHASTQMNHLVYAHSRTDGRIVSMHRLLMDEPKGVRIDHVNHDGLDNRRSNLRLATCKQNQCNRGPIRTSRTGFKGVHLTPSGRYHAEIRSDYKTISLGRLS